MDPKDSTNPMDPKDSTDAVSFLAGALWRWYNSPGQKKTRANRAVSRRKKSYSGEVPEWPIGHDWKSCVPLTRAPRVRIPPSPPVVIARSCAREVGNPVRSGRKQRYRYHPCAAGKPSYHQWWIVLTSAGNSRAQYAW